LDRDRDERGRGKIEKGNGTKWQERASERVQETELDARSTRDATARRRAPASGRAGSTQPAPNDGGWAAIDGLATAAEQSQPQPPPSPEPQQEQDPGQLDWDFGPPADDGGGNNGNNSVNGDAQGWAADNGGNEAQNTAGNDYGWGNNDNNNNNEPDSGGGGWNAEVNNQAGNDTNNNSGQHWLSNNQGQQDQQTAQEPSW
ncbi:uncharacterized protein BDV17DRAFT_251603, partial [Aspergillus undulatus]|uniref:uncharacterized protein n=1 Tax=Aspergillus undulatus TaxID=1810928 RepID=UPI003CCDB3E4